MPWAIEQAHTYPDILNSPLMPSIEESMSVIANAGRAVGGWGAPAVSGPANLAANIARLIGPFMDFYSGNRFGTAWDHATAARVAARREEYEMRRDQMLDATELAYNNGKRILDEYDTILELYKTGELDEEEMKDVLRQAATKHHDEKIMGNMIDNGNFAGIEHFLTFQRNKLNDMMAGATAQRVGNKQSGKTAAQTTADSWLADSGGKAGLRPLPTGPGQELGQETAKGAMSVSDKEIAAKFATDHGGLSEQGMREAHDIYLNGKPNMSDAAARKLHGEGYDAVLGAADEIKDRVNKVANAPIDPNLSEQDQQKAIQAKMDQIKAIAPEVAVAVEGLRKYRIDPASEGAKLRPQLVNLTEAVDPNYRSGNYKIVQDLSRWDSFSGKNIYRTNQLKSGGMMLAAALSDLPENEKIPLRKIMSWFDTQVVGDDRYTRVYDALRTMATEASAVTGQGQVRVTLVNNFLKFSQEFASPRQMRVMMRDELKAGYTNIDSVRYVWHQMTRDNSESPLIDPHVIAIYRGFMHMNPYTGEMPSDAPREVLSTSKPIEGQRGRSDLEEWQKYKPLTEETRSKYEKYIDDNKSNPDPRVQEAVRKATRYLEIY